MILRPHDYQPGMEIDWETELTELLDDLLETQQEMLRVLGEKREAMTQRDLKRIQSLQPLEESLCKRLIDCQERRADILTVAKQAQLPDENLTQLSRAVATDANGNIHHKVKNVSDHTNLIRHQSLTNWIIAQRNLLHVSQLLEIIASGGQQMSTYGNAASTSPNGFMLDQQA